MKLQKIMEVIMYKIGEEEIEAVAKVIRSGKLFKINDGLQETKNGEEDLKKLLNCKYAIIMTSGKAALISALTAMGVGPGDEVIIPAYTYIATAISVTAVGAIPVIAEIDDTLTLDPKDVEKKISKYTKAIIPVHIQGFPCNMDAIMKIANKHNIKVLEDACQADGGSYNGKRLGTIGDAGTFSFNYFKIISTGEGGALVTNDKKIYERSLIYHDSSAVSFFGNQLDGISEPLFAGSEYRTSEITSAILREQLKRLDDILFNLRKNKKRIVDAIKPYVTFVKTNDAKGECSTTIGISFEDAKIAIDFAESEGVGGWLPINTGKHIYTNWTPIMEKRGAMHPGMDPYKMSANKELNHNYSMDMCPKTLDYLSKTVYIANYPYADDSFINQKIEAIIKAIKKVKGE